MAPIDLLQFFLVLQAALGQAVVFLSSAAAWPS
jgi:hypothetical protein